MSLSVWESTWKACVHETRAFTLTHVSCLLQFVNYASTVNYILLLGALVATVTLVGCV